MSSYWFGKGALKALTKTKVKIEGIFKLNLSYLENPGKEAVASPRCPVNINFITSYIAEGK